MDIFASVSAIRAQAFEAARCRVFGNGSITNPWPAGSDAHATWQAEFDRLVSDMQAEAA